MAKMPMKRVRIVALRSERKKLLERLQILGSVEIDGSKEIPRGFDRPDTAAQAQVFRRNTELAGQARALSFAEAQANRHIAMTMNDWIAKLDGILTLNGRELLKNAGRISHEIAEETAALRLEEFKGRLREEERRASLEELERDLRNLENNNNDKQGAQ